MGTPKVSVSLGGLRKGPPPSNGTKRSRSAFQDDDEEIAEHGRTETVSHFNKASGGAFDESKPVTKHAPLAIPRQANRDWREAANKRKRQKSGLPNQNDDRDLEDVIIRQETSKPQYGLNVASRGDRADSNVLGDGPAATMAMDEAGRNQIRAPSPSDTLPSDQNAKDQEALDALLGKTTLMTNLVVPQNSMSEADAFQYDVVEAPDMASLAEYADMPVEQFGAAMLRGMGWKDGEGIGSQRGVKIPKTAGKVPARRSNLLGIGAKEDAALAGEMGAWGKAAKGAKGEIKIYNPVLLRDKKTGEMYTEEELKKKQEREERDKYEMEFERKEKERERWRRREEEAEEEDARDRRRQERTDGHYNDRHREKDTARRRHDKDSDEEYYRRKEKETRRHSQREGRDSHDYDRERSGRHRDGVDRNDERHRDRHRSDRERDRRR